MTLSYQWRFPWSDFRILFSIETRANFFSACLVPWCIRHEKLLSTLSTSLNAKVALIDTLVCTAQALLHQDHWILWWIKSCRNEFCIAIKMLQFHFQFHHVKVIATCLWQVGQCLGWEFCFETVQFFRNLKGPWNASSKRWWKCWVTWALMLSWMES